MNYPQGFKRSVLILILGMASACAGSAPPLATTTPVISPALTRYPTRTPTPAVSQTATPQQEIPSLTPTPQIHIVQKDELGSEIALRYGITIAQLQSANPDVDINYLIEGAELVIPAPQLTPSAELYTPTPVSLLYDTPRCYATADRKTWCLLNVTNLQDQPVYYLTGQLSVESGQGVVTRNVSALADLIPPGGQLPLILYLDEPVGYPYHAGFTPTTAFQADSAPVRRLLIEDQQVTIDPDGLQAVVTGTINPGGQAIEQAAVILAGYQEDIPAGVRRIEWVNPVPNSQPFSFEASVYTVGPRIDRIVIYAEGK